MSRRFRRTPGRWVIMATVLLLLSGCGGTSFDPAKDRPCAFFTKDELNKYELTVRLDHPDQCVFMQPLGTLHGLTGVTVEYRDGAVAAVAKDLGLSPVTGKQAKDSRVRFQGSTKSDPFKGTCRMAAPIGDARTLLVAFDTDTSGVVMSQVPVDEPCAFLAAPVGYPEILAKLNR